MPTIDLITGALSRQAPTAASPTAPQRPELGGVGGATAAPEAGAPGGDFAAELMDALKEVNQVQLEADDKATAFVRGEDIAVHQVMAAMTRAELSVQLTTAVASKAVQAYQEIWRIDV